MSDTMRIGAIIAAALAAGLILAACGSGPSSGPASSAGDEAARIERHVEHLEGLLAARPRASAVLGAFLVARPDGVRPTEIAYDAGRARVKGTAATNDLLADYIARLEQSPALAGVTLAGSSMKLDHGAESWEFGLEASAGARGPALGPAADPAARLAELVALVPERPESAPLLRELQRLALEAGLQMTRFGPGAETSGEFTASLPVEVELTGSWNELAGYLRGLVELSGLWTVERFSARAADPGDPRSPVRAAVAARAHYRR